MDIMSMDLDELFAKINLIGELCHLNHGIGEKPPPAENYLCQYIGKKDDPSVGVELLVIPICKECAAALYNEDWLLFYCLTCNSSQWLLKSKAKKLYPKWESIRFLHTCPNCAECPMHTE
jgi:hypothetical protein